MSKIPVVQIAKAIEERNHLNRNVKGPVSDVTPDFRNVTLMLTEACNLDCWMCDFGKSKGLKHKLALEPEVVAELFKHPYFTNLKVVTLTGGEPFSNKAILPICENIIKAKPSIIINFSTNAMLREKIITVVDALPNVNRGSLLVSIDGMASHDEQRGVEGCFSTSVSNLATFKNHFKHMPIIIKMTVTRINYSEVYEAHEYFTKLGYGFTAKLAHNNPHYTNKLNSDRDADFSLTATELADLKDQVVKILQSKQKNIRRNEIIDLKGSLDDSWQRSGHCSSPSSRMFIDTHLNIFTCKEFEPIMNLANQSLDELIVHPKYQMIIDHEKNNTSECTYCNSQMKMPTAKGVFGLWSNLTKRL